MFLPFISVVMVRGGRRVPESYHSMRSLEYLASQLPCSYPYPAFSSVQGVAFALALDTR